MIDPQDTWASIDEFPGYIVNQCGEVSSDRYNRRLTQTPVRRGSPTVGLSRDGLQNRRSVAKLVAEAFLPPPIREDFNTVMHIDGDRSNCFYQNLMWRPRWFAIRYHQNREAGWYESWTNPILCVETDEMFDSIVEPAMKYGLLENHIFDAIHNQTPVFPTGFHFVRI